MPPHKKEAAERTQRAKSARAVWTTMKQRSAAEYGKWKTRSGPAVPADRMEVKFTPGPAALVAALSSFAHSPGAQVQVLTARGFVGLEEVAHCEVAMSSPAAKRGGAAPPSVASISNLESKDISCEYGMLLMHAVKICVYQHDGRRAGAGAGAKGPAPKIHVLVPADQLDGCIFWAANGFEFDAAGPPPGAAQPGAAAPGVAMTFDFRHSN